MVYVSANKSLDEGDLEHGSRVCVSCNERKDIQEYFWYNTPKKKKAGRRAKCKKCIIGKAKEYRANNRERYRRNALGWHLNKKYGLSLEQYDALLEEQNGLCKICDKEFDMEDQNRRPHVDHCHTTGKVRGILCFGCNTGIGKLNDSVVLLKSAIKYLENS